VRKVGIFVHPRWEAAADLGRQLEARLRPQVQDVWLTAAWDEAAARRQVGDSDLLVCVGGDGTMLWAARTAIPRPVPILGVNMGRLGFLTEFTPEEALEKLPAVLEGAGRLEERTMLAVATSTGESYHALNDAVVGRHTVGRPVYVEASVDGRRLAFYRADAVLVATATGSTAYSFSAGGPILYPESRDLLLTPVAPHLMSGQSLVLPPQVVIELRVDVDHEAALSVDGQEYHLLRSGDVVTVTRSPHVARFLRFSEPAQHYATLAELLGWLRIVGPSGHQEGDGRSE